MTTSVDAAPAIESPTVGQYLAQRLAQLGATSLFGLPGDFNLTLLDQTLTVDSVTWVGSTNELNSSYAADAFARAGRGLGAIVTTFGVGELSAVNGLAGSYSEDVPVVRVVGMPSRAAMDQGVPLHHTLPDGDFDHGLRVAREFTVADTVLRPESAAWKSTAYSRQCSPLPSRGSSAYPWMWRPPWSRTPPTVNR
ncbi:thiamine pyrophosphate-binding protein [Kocuria sp. ZOR0020]|uniref:thiamine pyrophosphate-binding protein n=1 Tax=Kocuria sp. ZOR0020 TaxID=1339234 RepID=UPI00068B581F|nr:thiamine pyrophosphate-binding protein [Kocuria sp. ZOR0020]